MTRLAIPFALALLLAACRDDTPAGCRAVACVCADGSAGTRACGSHTCVCDTGTCVLRSPERFDFGGVPPGTAARGEVVLANEGDGACAIAGLRLDGCGPDYGLEVGSADATVPAGGTLPIPVTFRPSVGADAAPCTLAFDSPDSLPVHRTVSLDGHLDASCLAVEPRQLAFALDTAGCGTEEAAVTVTNRCGQALALGEVSADGPSFFVRSLPTLPWPLAPGAHVEVVVGYRPPAPGDQLGALRLGVEGFAPIDVSLAGSAGEGAWLTDHFAQEPLPQVDILFVIDNGTTMAVEQVTLGDRLRTFASALQARRLDYHLGVTTTGLAPGGDCPGGVGGGEDGRLFPVDGARPRVLASDTPDLENALQANVRVGACREGPNQALEAALRALSPPVADSADDPRHPEAADGNLGFLRPDAMLEVFAVTDRRDVSSGSPDSYFNAFVALKDYQFERFRFHAVTGDRESGCSRAGVGVAEPGDRLIELADRTGGSFTSICSPDWELWPSRPPDPFKTCWRLTAPPDDSNLDGRITDGEPEVWLNGEATPARGPEGQPIWAYDGTRNELCFSVLAAPEPGAAIDVRYRLACVGQE